MDYFGLDAPATIDKICNACEIDPSQFYIAYP